MRRWLIVVVGSALLAACSGRSLDHPSLSVPAVVSPSLSITLSRSTPAAGAEREPTYIFAQTASADIAVYNGSTAMGTPITTACANFNSAPSVTLSVSAPLGNTTIVLTTYSGLCSGSGGAGSSGSGTPLTRFTGTGNVLSTSTSISTVYNGGQPIVLGLVPGGPALPTVPVSGTVVDYFTGAPVGGATLTINSVSGTSTLARARNPLGVVEASSMKVRTEESAGRTIRTSSGAFSFAAYGGALASIVASAPGYLTSTNGYTVPLSGGTLRPIQVVPLTAELAQWIALVNADRLSNGNPVALALDNEATIAAMRQAKDQATAVYQGHWNTLGQSAADQCSLVGRSACGQNGGMWSGWQTVVQMEAAYMAEKANCPNGQAQGCVFAHNTGHFINIISSSGVIGLGYYHVGSLPTYTNNGYTQDFTIPPSAVLDVASIGSGKVGQSTTIRFRVLSAGTWFGYVSSTTCPWQVFTASQLAATSPGSPYPSTCGTGPSVAATTTKDGLDAATVNVTFTPTVPGVFSVGLAGGPTGTGISAVLNVPN